MGEIKDKLKGSANEMAGKAKQAAGDMTNDPKLKGEGAAQELKGKAQKLKGDVKGVINDV